MNFMKIPIRSDDDDHEGEDQETAIPQAPEESSELPEASVAAPPAPEPAPLEVRLQELEAALAKKAKEYDAVHDQLLHLRADFDNYRKRMMRQSEEVKQFATADLVIELLPGLDNLERALAAARQDATPSSALIAEGVGMVLKQLKEALARVGVRDIAVQGQPFDPARHEAVEVVAVPPHQDGMIVEEVQRGYMVYDRLLRPAKVVVGKADRDSSHGGA
jgi:molecular chaperone GrpE